MRYCDAPCAHFRRDQTAVANPPGGWELFTSPDSDHSNFRHNLRNQCLLSRLLCRCNKGEEHHPSAHLQFPVSRTASLEQPPFLGIITNKMRPQRRADVGQPQSWSSHLVLVDSLHARTPCCSAPRPALSVLSICISPEYGHHHTNLCEVDATRRYQISRTAASSNANRLQCILHPAILQ
ncbi:hypothetical protein CCHR01_16606 [Colletotrichum chrysophilum]|uniref:Uncharacterized protein n=1 Tax=Colletotrichum chrysophilum TaxID=1836956 RepID=A0AAD9E7M8_9PEZI|nr:hypothetical protein CCHR01_16606 [Colletotrichum chrysophilum]